MELSQLTVKNLLVQQIRGEIICGNYAPGQRLPLRDLADQFKVSTQPVREALRELEAVGLVSSEPRRGAIVTQLSPEELEDIYDIRATLESMATKFAVPNITSETYDLLEDLINEMDQHIGEVADLVQLNFDFHVLIYEASNRTHLMRLNRTLRHRTEHYLHAYMIKQGGMPLAQEEHRAILEACRQKDDEGAAELMYDHVAKAGRGIIEYVQKGSTG